MSRRGSRTGMFKAGVTCFQTVERPSCPGHVFGEGECVGLLGSLEASLAWLGACVAAQAESWSSFPGGLLWE